jgi:hypothetical protein
MLRPCYDAHRRAVLAAHLGGLAFAQLVERPDLRLQQLSLAHVVLVLDALVHLA